MTAVSCYNAKKEGTLGSVHVFTRLGYQGTRSPSCVNFTFPSVDPSLAMLTKRSSHKKLGNWSDTSVLAHVFTEERAFLH